MIPTVFYVQVKQGSNGVKLEVFLLSSDKFMSGSVFWKNGKILQKINNVKV